MTEQDRPGWAGLQAPPWLWIWIALFIWRAPDWFSHFRGSIRALLSIPYTGELYSSGFSRLVLTPTILEALPTATLALAIIALLFPQLRARWVERRYALAELSKDYPSAAVREVQTFIHERAPRVEIKWQLAESRRIARVYPTRYTNDTLAIFGGLLRVWRRNRPAGEAILLHELAHHRHRDAILMGVASPLRALVGLWVPVALGLALLVWAVESAGILATQPLPGGDSPLREILGRLFLQIIPALVPIIITVLLWTLALFIVPVVGVWCAELNADRFAIARESKPGALSHWLSQQREPERRMGWLVQRIAHPPLGLRCWMAHNAHRPVSLVILLLLFPAAYVVRLTLLIVWGVLAHLVGGMPASQLAETVPRWIASYLDSMAYTLTLLGVAMLLWPLLVALRRRLQWARTHWTLYWALGLVLCLPLLIGRLQPDPCVAVGATIATDKAWYRPGELVVIQYSGLPGNEQDWVTVVRHGAPVDDWGEWQFTGGTTSGEHTIVISEPGRYEARVFFDWPTCGFDIKARTVFAVTTRQGG
ncbi:hypothetical protein CAI21_17490 [Alkalilimnicola ehrlichii]|uniref:Peptidase M48 domain-containing protein n=1 Tax=Alkalilimnicola ehrlichii TaxID=351052 RepID=A0A3E0WMG8_9GAMM|nr:hypothetical protein [Alkalilimnicola ehrlichii]RFA26271.1 hypothetical protein CAI21_17490 [Alkalilimnicola ehrlichii]RFA33257.1 hypothetical protein CAL65_17975 [Alkalilimnicola ehrlichii]